MPFSILINFLFFLDQSFYTCEIAIKAHILQNHYDIKRNKEQEPTKLFLSGEMIYAIRYNYYTKS